MITRTTDRLGSVVSRVLREIVADYEDMEWDLSVVTEPRVSLVEGEMLAEFDHFVVLWISVKEPEDGLSLNARIAVPLIQASDENIETMVRDTWEAILVERMETAFSKPATPEE